MARILFWSVGLLIANYFQLVFLNFLLPYSFAADPELEKNLPLLFARNGKYLRDSDKKDSLGYSLCYVSLAFSLHLLFVLLEGKWRTAKITAYKQYQPAGLALQEQLMYIPTCRIIHGIGEGILYSKKLVRS